MLNNTQYKIKPSITEDDYKLVTETLDSVNEIAIEICDWDKWKTFIDLLTRSRSFNQDELTALDKWTALFSVKFGSLFNTYNTSKDFAWISDFIFHEWTGELQGTYDTMKIMYDSLSERFLDKESDNRFSQENIIGILNELSSFRSSAANITDIVYEIEKSI